MSQVHVIRHKVFLEGRSIRSVAAEMGVSRNTVRKYLTQSEPERVQRVARRAPVREEAEWRIEKLFEELGGRLTAKQRLTGTRVVELLREDGFTGGSTVVREVLAERNRRRREVFIPLVHRAGEEAQVDFFEIRADLIGERRSVWLFLMHLPFCGYDFVWLYERCNQIAFLDGHVRAFAHFGGVPRRVIYDNLTAAVKRILGIERRLTERFQALASTYLFEPCFARPGEGHDKGSVERRGQTVRLQYFTPVPAGDSLEQIVSSVQKRIDETSVEKEIASGGTVAQRYEQEKRLFSSLPARAFRAERAVPVIATRQALVTVEGATYSVPSSWARATVMAYLGVATVRLECRGETVTTAKVAKGARSVKYLHYQKELARKPQAVRQVAPELLAELGEPYRSLWNQLCERYSERTAARVLAALIGLRMEHGADHIRGQVEKLLSLPQPTPEPSPQPREVSLPERLSALQIDSGVAADYDCLLVRGGAR
ncbi:MAG: IS21 family transposase [Spirochaetaceae bacterium]|nr:IS21 family transposase [Spirochaetaceae bacterium]